MYKRYKRLYVPDTLHRFILRLVGLEQPGYMKWPEVTTEWYARLGWGGVSGFGASHMTA